jgi:hypothetical protein
MRVGVLATHGVHKDPTTNHTQQFEFGGIPVPLLVPLPEGLAGEAAAAIERRAKHGWPTSSDDDDDEDDGGGAMSAIPAPSVVGPSRAQCAAARTHSNKSTAQAKEITFGEKRTQTMVGEFYHATILHLVCRAGRSRHHRQLDYEEQGKAPAGLLEEDTGGGEGARPLVARAQDRAAGRVVPTAGDSLEECIALVLESAQEYETDAHVNVMRSRASHVPAKITKTTSTAAVTKVRDIAAQSAPTELHELCANPFVTTTALKMLVAVRPSSVGAAADGRCSIGWLSLVRQKQQLQRQLSQCLKDTPATALKDSAVDSSEGDSSEGASTSTISNMLPQSRLLPLQLLCINSGPHATSVPSTAVVMQAMTTEYERQRDAEATMNKLAIKEEEHAHMNRRRSLVVARRAQQKQARHNQQQLALREKVSAKDAAAAAASNAVSAAAVAAFSAETAVEAALEQLSLPSSSLRGSACQGTASTASTGQSGGWGGGSDGGGGGSGGGGSDCAWRAHPLCLLCANERPAHPVLEVAQNLRDWEAQFPGTISTTSVMLISATSVMLISTTSVMLISSSSLLFSKVQVPLREGH